MTELPPDPGIEVRGNQSSDIEMGSSGLVVCKLRIGHALSAEDTDYRLMVQFRVHDPDEEVGHYTIPPLVFSSRSQELSLLSGIASTAVCRCFGDQIRHLLEYHQRCEHFNWNKIFPDRSNNGCPASTCTGPDQFGLSGGDSA